MLWYKSGLSDQIVRLYQKKSSRQRNLLYLKQVKYVKLYRKLSLFIKKFIKVSEMWQNVGVQVSWGPSGEPSNRSAIFIIFII